MGRYTSYQKQKERVQRNQVHPVMRGVGCILLVLVPILAYGTSIYAVNYAVRRGLPIPRTWLGAPDIPPILWKLGGLNMALNYIHAQNNLVANLVFAIAITVVIFGILSILYGILYKFFGPPEYGPTDMPPERGRKVKRYKR